MNMRLWQTRKRVTMRGIRVGGIGGVKEKDEGKKGRE